MKRSVMLSSPWDHHKRLFFHGKVFFIWCVSVKWTNFLGSKVHGCRAKGRTLWEQYSLEPYPQAIVSVQPLFSYTVRLMV